MRDVEYPYEPFPSPRPSASKGDPYQDFPTCPLCLRPMIPGTTTNKHHMIPRSFGGKETTLLHRICHSKIHSVFTRRELLHVYNTPEKLREHEAIQIFIRWLQNKDPEFYDKNRPTQGKPKR